MSYTKRDMPTITKIEHIVGFHRGEAAHSMMRSFSKVPPWAHVIDIEASHEEGCLTHYEVTFIEEHEEKPIGGE